MNNGYYVHLVDMSTWLSAAQKSVFVKNKVRKELWQELVNMIIWDPIPVAVRSDYYRIPHSSFVSMQTFCLIDGTSSNISDNQLLNFCTTLDGLRSRLPTVRLLDYTVRRELPTQIMSHTTALDEQKHASVSHEAREEEHDGDSEVDVGVMSESQSPTK